MDEQRKRIKRQEVSDETRTGRHRAAVNPRARLVPEEPEAGKRDLFAKAGKLADRFTSREDDAS